MRYNKLGDTNIEVSEICLGTMTYGEQNTKEEGHEQMSYAFDQGINFFDTAEMYSVPGRKETQGRTEEIVGSWVKKTSNRQKVRLATKVTGPSAGLHYIRSPVAVEPNQIIAAIEGSLKRLQTDYVDLYQVHWPQRKANYFGKLGYKHDDNDPWKDNFEEVLLTLHRLQLDGKIRHYGLSNETAWGMHRVEQVAVDKGIDKIVSVQNPYSLLNRTYEIGMAEMSIRTNIGLLAYSPLAMGLLTGKYLNGKKPKEGRLVKFHQFSRYANDLGLKAAAKYDELAKSKGISLAQMSLAFIRQQEFVTSTIIGATNMRQLQENVSSRKLNLDDATLKEIEEIHTSIPNPNP